MWNPSFSLTVEDTLTLVAEQLDMPEGHCAIIFIHFDEVDRLRFCASTPGPPTYLETIISSISKVNLIQTRFYLSTIFSGRSLLQIIAAVGRCPQEAVIIDLPPLQYENIVCCLSRFLDQAIPFASDSSLVIIKGMSRYCPLDSFSLNSHRYWSWWFGYVTSDHPQCRYQAPLSRHSNHPQAVCRRTLFSFSSTDTIIFHWRDQWIRLW